MFDKMKELMAMKQQMEQIKRELDAAVFEMSSSGGTVKVSMNGAQEMKGIWIQGELPSMDKTHLEKEIKDAYNKAIKRSHEIAAQKMKEITGVNAPGLR